MVPKEDDITRLKNLLASGLSITEAAKRMGVSRSTAQRLKKKIVEISDTEGDTEIGALGLGNHCAWWFVTISASVAAPSAAHRLTRK